MKAFGELFQTADCKTEKHVPVIECPDRVRAGELLPLKVSIDKEIVHPNIAEHHLRYITVYFHPEGKKLPYEAGHFEFNVHGESAEEPN